MSSASICGVSEPARMRSCRCRAPRRRHQVAACPQLSRGYVQRDFRVKPPHSGRNAFGDIGGKVFRWRLPRRESGPVEICSTRSARKVRQSSLSTPRRRGTTGVRSGPRWGFVSRWSAANYSVGIFRPPFTTGSWMVDCGHTGRWLVVYRRSWRVSGEHAMRR
jgi:hypothetical protein